MFSKSRRFWLSFFALLLLFGGLLYIAIPYIYFAHERQAGISQNISFWQTSQLTSEQLALGTPIHMDLNRLNIHLPIAAGVYDRSNNSWLLDRTHAFYMHPGQFPLSQSAQPLIYGHEIKGVLINLNGISANEPLVITNTRGQRFFFRYVGDRIIYPNQVNAINLKPPKKGVTLLTCTNPFFTQRRLYYFAYVGVDIASISK